MGNLRSLKRNVQKNPLQIWRAKQTAKRKQEALVNKPQPFPLTSALVNDITKALKNENESKQKEAQTENAN